MNCSFNSVIWKGMVNYDFELVDDDMVDLELSKKDKNSPGYSFVFKTFYNILCVLNFDLLFFFFNDKIFQNIT